MIHKNATRCLLAALRRIRVRGYAPFQPVPLGSLLDDNALYISVSLQLGARFHLPPQYRRGAAADEYEQDSLCSLKSGGRVSRYYVLNETIRRTLAFANVPATLEPKRMMEWRVIVDNPAE